jgi:hypothetical protein
VTALHRRLIAVAFLLAGTLCTQAVTQARAEEAVQIKEGTGRFLFKDPQTATGKTLPVWTYRPKSFTPDTPILFVMHGVNRNADDYRDNWIDLADKYGLLIVAPEFSKKNFPRSWTYNLGNVIRPAGPDGALVPTPEKDWSYPIIDRIFEQVRQSTGSRRTTFSIFGHSAGAQFVHRYLTFTGGPKVDFAICANAGWYTLPNDSEAFPYGLGLTHLSPEHVKAAFAKKMVILLGDMDIVQDANFRMTPEAMRQGPTRFDRGKFYFATAQREAAKLGVPLNWRVVVVPGVGHDNAGMAGTAAQLIHEADTAAH